MTTREARRLITRTFEQSYDEATVRQFVQNLLVGAEMKHRNHRSGSMIYAAFRDHIAQYKRLAKYVDPSGQELDVLAVKLNAPHKLERARTMQRNFVATYLNDDSRPFREAALVAYYADGTDAWRLSLVQLEYRTVIADDGTVGTEKELTPVRYSFLVGPDEPTHTPERQFEGLVQQESSPTLDALHTAFDLDVVTEAFFEAYRDHYLTLADAVQTACQAHPATQQEFERCTIAPADFAKKLLGQLVFLYFLQKKGWLGVRQSDEWGDGPTDFLRRLYDQEYVAYNAFYTDILDPLFYDALATDRGRGNYFGRLDCRIPFLNGGLFQPLNDFRRGRVDLDLPNDVFGAIFDTFDRYNFTVREDEPLDKEVAVDPEMLGKVFEKMLDVSERKEHGAFYTPRDIVHYMCQESLIDHLDSALNTKETSLGTHAGQQNAFGPAPGAQGTLSGSAYTETIDRAALTALVREGQSWREHDRRVRSGSHPEGGKYDGTYRAPAAIRTHAAALDACLADLKICDPAVGSGAFPVGMMQEIVQARRVLATYLDDDTDRSAYALKRHAIQHTIHGVDIEPSAVDIAQLRLWLSLVVDEDDFTQIKPLPNLRYKIVQGDALSQMQRTLANNEQEERLYTLMERYVSTAYPSEKERLQDEIDALLDTLMGNDGFDLRIHFGAVWKAQEGFDIVIGNPPYVRQETLSASQKETYKAQYNRTYYGSADLYVYFMERGMQLLRPNGVFCYIVSNKWMRARYGKHLRSYMETKRLVELVDFGDLPVFQGTTAYPCIVRMHKAGPNESFQAVEVDALDYDALPTYVQTNRFEVLTRSLQPKGWSLVNKRTQRLLDAMQDTGTPLGDYLETRDLDLYRGVLTGLNKAFVIDADTRRDLIDADPSSAALIKPFLKGRDINRYQPPEPRYYVIFARRGVDIDAYPAIKEHLLQYKEQLMPKHRDWPSGKKWPGRKPGAYEWYEIQDTVAYYEIFESAKLILPDIAKRAQVTLDTDGGLYCVNKAYVIGTDSRYLLGLLNSRLLLFVYETMSAKYRGDYLRFIKQYLERLPIYEVPSGDTAQQTRTQIENLVQDQLDQHAARAQAATESEEAACAEAIAATDAAINDLVYALYGLSNAEIALVEAATADAIDG